MTSKKPKMPEEWAGGSWRFQAWHVQSDGMQDPPIRLDSAEIDGPTEFDELVVGNWFHMEQMDDCRWVVGIGPIGVYVEVHADGKHDVYVEDRTGDQDIILEYKRGVKVDDE